MTPIRLHTAATPNGHKASIMLEETGLPYEVRHVDIERGGQHDPAFVALNPNRKIPVIEDSDLGLALAESGAILHHLARRSGRLLPADGTDASRTLEWTLFQAAHVGPTLGQLWHWRVFARDRPPAVLARFEREARRVLGVLDGRLVRHPHLVGEAYGIADVMTWPWIRAAVEGIGVPIDDFPALSRWYAAVGDRPAVRRGLAVPPPTRVQA
jgi:GST-like protein